MMVFMKKPKLKLFGKNILLTDKGRSAAGDCSVESREGGAVGFAGWLDVRGGEENGEDGVEAGGEDRLGRRPADEEEGKEEICEADDQDSNGTSEESNITTTTTTNNPRTSTEDGPHKALKKPDKILPCPRCKCSDTKFCYFNNYNVNQPRHFCRGCHRYWTAGGTMRNLPVGSGRRRHKAHQGPNSPGLSFGFEIIFSFYPTPCYDYTWTAWNTGLPGPGPNGTGPAKRSREGEAVKSLI